MDRIMQEQIAAFRYGLIAPIVSRQTPLGIGELKQTLEAIADRHYEIPGSRQTQVSVRTLERYLSMYRSGGWDALKPKERSDKGNSKLSKVVLDHAIQLRKEQPERSVEQIVFLLEQHGIVQPGEVAISTLARHLRASGFSRKDVLEKRDPGYRRFEAEDVHVMWQSDAQHTLYLPDPKNPQKSKKAILFAILDDYSRMIVHCQFYWDEKLPRLEDTLKKAILRHGIPEQFYCDNGAVFSSHHLNRICGKLGIQLSHSRPYRPAGRGKIERFFRFIDTSFKIEAYEAIRRGVIQTLEQLNHALASWIDGYYHQRIHGTTKEMPLVRAKQSKRQPKKISIVELEDIFLWEETRKVNKTGCISLQGNEYEVDLELSQKTVTLRYDPFDLGTIQVWFEGTSYGVAKAIDLKRKYDRRVKPDDVPPPQVSEESLSFFEAAEAKRQVLLQSEPLTFANERSGHR